MSFSQLLKGDRVPWAKLRCEEIEIDDSLTVENINVVDLDIIDLVVNGILELKTDSTIDADTTIIDGSTINVEGDLTFENTSTTIFDGNVTINNGTTTILAGELNFNHAATIVNDVVLSNKLTTTALTLSTNPGQTELTRNRYDQFVVTYAGTAIGAITGTSEIKFSRVGKSVTCQIDSAVFANGTANSPITVDLSGFPAYVSDYIPAGHVYQIIPIKDNTLDPGVKTQKHERVTNGLLSLFNNTLTIYYGIPGDVFTFNPGFPNGWEENLTFSYVAGIN